MKEMYQFSNSGICICSGVCICPGTVGYFPSMAEKSLRSFLSFNFVDSLSDWGPFAKLRWSHSKRQRSSGCGKSVGHILFGQTHSLL